MREKELQTACERINAKECLVLDKDDLKDNPKIWWKQDAIISVVNSWVTKWKADAIITFDAGGVSGHINHRAVSSAITQVLFPLNTNSNHVSENTPQQPLPSRPHSSCAPSQPSSLPENILASSTSLSQPSNFSSAYPLPCFTGQAPYLRMTQRAGRGTRTEGYLSRRWGRGSRMSMCFGRIRVRGAGIGGCICW